MLNKLNLVIILKSIKMNKFLYFQLHEALDEVTFN